MGRYDREVLTETVMGLSELAEYERPLMPIVQPDLSDVLAQVPGI